MFSQELHILAQNALSHARAKRLKIACAESCTGGLLAASLTEIPGCSDVFERGFVTYSNEAKAEMLGVPMELILQHGAVSREVACAMAKGALCHSHANIAVSVTGIAGPGGGSVEKPVGLVWFAVAVKTGSCEAYNKIFSGTRQEIRLQAVAYALNLYG